MTEGPSAPAGIMVEIVDVAEGVRHVVRGPRRRAAHRRVSRRPAAAHGSIRP